MSQSWIFGTTRSYRNHSNSQSFIIRGSIVLKSFCNFYKRPKSLFCTKSDRADQTISRRDVKLCQMVLPYLSAMSLRLDPISLMVVLQQPKTQSLITLKLLATYHYMPSIVGILESSPTSHASDPAITLLTFLYILHFLLLQQKIVFLPNLNQSSTVKSYQK